MIPKYKKLTSIAGWVFLAATLLLIPLVAMNRVRENISDSWALLQTALALVWIVAFWISCWATAKAKGYSGLVGIVLPIFSILGLIILILLRDKHPQASATQEATGNSTVTTLRSTKWLDGRARLSVLLGACWFVVLAAYASYEVFSNPEGWLDAKPTENRIFTYSLGVEGRLLAIDNVFFVGRPDATDEHLVTAAREKRPDLFANHRPQINWRVTASKPTLYYKWVFDSKKFLGWAFGGSFLVALAAYSLMVGIQWVSAGIRPAPAKALEALIFSAYGNPPPPKTAKPEEAAQIAYEELLKGLVGKEEVAKLTGELSAGPIPYSTHDLALSVALNFFKRPELVPHLSNAQLFARMKAAEWLQQGKAVLPLVKSFEGVLYKLYKPKV